ncbi:MAG: TIGR01777 family protein [Nocardioides sp.]|nr:TIGR01777 family protein [Nocardioides sp.]
MSTADARMSVLLAGGSGFLGTRLQRALRDRGHTVTTLTRRAPEKDSEASWDPYAGELDAALVEGADVVVNLAGSPLIGNPHSKRWARDLRDSRVVTTAVLAKAIAASERRPAFLAGNGIAWYGDHGSAVLTEASDTRGHALLTTVTRDWQEAALPASEAGARVCVLRTSPVMDASGPPLQWLKLLFRTGTGGRLGSGEQYMPMSSLRDWLGAVVHLAEHPDASGPFNICLPEAPTNREFTRALAERVAPKGLAPFPVPALLLRAAAGDLAPELLGSVNVRPAALEASGYTFLDPDVGSLLDTGL